MIIGALAPLSSAQGRKPSDERREMLATVRSSVVEVTGIIGGARSSGTGVVVDVAGMVITNYHVVEGCNQLRVSSDRARDGLNATFVAGKPEWDLALLRIEVGESEEYDWLRSVSVPLPSRESPVEGDAVLALGFPLGLGYTVNSGVVSGNRIYGKLPKELRAGLLYDPLSTWVQTDCPINPGNSGGPLIDGSGRLLGLVTWGLPDRSDVSFAISATHISEFVAANATKQSPLAPAVPAISAMRAVESINWPTDTTGRTGYLQIRGPASASIEIGGVSVGRMPPNGSDLVVVGIPSGYRSVTLSKRYHQPTSRRVSIPDSGIELVLFPMLVRRSARVAITTIPVAAEISLSGPVSGTVLKSKPEFVFNQLPWGEFEITVRCAQRTMHKRLELAEAPEFDLTFDFFKGALSTNPSTLVAPSKARIHVGAGSLGGQTLVRFFNVDIERPLSGKVVWIDSGAGFNVNVVPGSPTSNSLSADVFLRLREGRVVSSATLLGYVRLLSGPDGSIQHSAEVWADPRRKGGEPPGIAPIVFSDLTLPVNGVTRGMSRAALEALLGKPNSVWLKKASWGAGTHMIFDKLRLRITLDTSTERVTGASSW